MSVYVCCVGRFSCTLVMVAVLAWSDGLSMKMSTQETHGFSWFAYVLKVYMSMYCICLKSTKVCVFKSSVHIMLCYVNIHRLCL